MRNICGLLLGLLMITGCSEEKKKPDGNLELTGNISGLKSGTLYVQKLQDTSFVVLDSIKISGNSSFTTYLNIDSPEMLYLYLDRGATNTIDNNLMFFAEPGKMNIDTDLETFFATAKITGSKNHDLYEEYKKVKSRFVNQELDLTLEKMTAFQNKKAFASEESNKKMEAIQKRKYLYAINFAVNNKNHEVAPYIALSEIHDANIKFLDTIANSLAPKIAQSKYGKLLTQYISDRKKAGE
ncbi:MAG TPA: DUF4369 domain-containing protein [Flavobacterium sp.]|jgi:hypothetical protein